jgi:hypothetical protein
VKDYNYFLRHLQHFQESFTNSVLVNLILSNWLHCGSRLSFSNVMRDIRIKFEI